MFLLVAVLTPLFVAVPPGTPSEAKVVVRSGVVFDGMLLCLYWDGTVGAWDVKTEKYAKDAAARLTRKGLLFLAADGSKLWAADEKTVYLWSAKKREWEKYCGFEADEEKLLAFTPAQGRPFLVFRSKIIDPTRAKGGTFKFPKDIDRLPGSKLSISATHGTDEMLWLGTHNGEWGGSLIGFEPESGKWIKARAGGVTSITQAGPDEIVVSCYLFHLGVQSTDIQVFKTDVTEVFKTSVTEKKSFSGLDNGCFYCLAYNPHDRTLYGMERTELVTVKDGKPTKVAEVPGGALSLIPLGPKALAVISDEGVPYLLRGGKLIRLPAP